MQIGRKRRILLVEDEESITAPLSEALAREGFDTSVAGTAASALDDCGRHARRTSCSST